MYVRLAPEVLAVANKLNSIGKATWPVTKAIVELLQTSSQQYYHSMNNPQKCKGTVYMTSYGQ